MSKRLWGLGAAALVSAAMAGAAVLASSPTQLAQVDAGGFRSEPVTVFEREGKKSGFLFATPETQAMQQDDGENPAFLWVEHGEKLWATPDGAAGKSCMSCHGAAASMRGVGATYPKVSKDTGKLTTLEHQINYCRTERMQATPFAWETQDMLGLSIFVMHQSRGLPMNVAVDGAAEPYFKKGDELYHTRRGQLNAACIHCHEMNSGNYIRADLLSEGRVNGFPLYRLKWGRPGSIHYRMEECYSQVRAIPEPYGSDELTTLQLYIAWRSNGLLIETPAVRR